MAKIAILVLLTVSLAPAVSVAQTVWTCGPTKGFQSFVANKQEHPPELRLIPGTANQKPCKSPVAKSVTKEHSWQLVDTKTAVEIDVDDGGTIVTLEIIPNSVVPSFKKDAARAQGMDVK